MAVKVKIPTPLRNLTQNQDTVEAESGALSSVVETLESQFPGMRERLLDEGGEIRRFVNIYVNGEDVRFLSGLTTASLGLMAGALIVLTDAAVVDLLTAVIAIAALAALVRTRVNSAWLIGALFWPSEVMAEAILSRIRAGSPSASASCTLWGPSPQCTVTALGASTPRLAR